MTDVPTAPMPRFGPTIATVPPPPARRHQLDVRPSCGRLSPGLGLICTVHAGHHGDHAAHGQDGRIITTWRDD